MNAKVLSLFCMAIIASVASMPHTLLKPEDLAVQHIWEGDKKILERERGASQNYQVEDTVIPEDMPKSIPEAAIKNNWKASEDKKLMEREAEASHDYQYMPISVPEAKSGRVRPERLANKNNWKASEDKKLMEREAEDVVLGQVQERARPVKGVPEYMSEKRATCMECNYWGCDNSSYCTLYCRYRGYRGGYCDSRAVCKCR